MSPDGPATGPDAEEDVEAVIRRLTEKLRVHPTHNRTRALLAIAYDRRTDGDREENIRRILVHSDSLNRKKIGKALWAATRVLRGKAFRDRSATAGLGEMDLQVALSFFGEALDLYAKGSPLWADVQTEMAITLLRHPGLWPNARYHLDKALAVYRTSASGPALAVAYELLGDWYVLVARKTGAARDRQAALGEYSRSLARTDRSRDTARWARLQLAIGRLAHAGGPAADDIAAGHFAAAAQALTGAIHRTARLGALRELADLHLRRRRWADALPHYAEALSLALDVAREPATVSGRRAAAVGISDLAHCLAYCQYRQGNPDQAVLTLEAGRGRLLLDRLADDDAEAGDSDPPGHAQRTRLRREIRELEAREYGGMIFLEDSERLELLRREYAELTATATGAQSAALIAELAPQEPSTALVVPLISPVGGAIFIVTNTDRCVAPENVLDFPSVTTRDIDRWLEGEVGSDDAVGERRSADDLGANTVPTAGWLTAYRRRDKDAACEERWRSTMSEVCGDLGRTLIGALANRLRELRSSRAVLVPAAGLQFLPLHAAVITDGPGARCLLDEVVVEYAPSAAIRSLLHTRRGGRCTAGPALVAGVSRYPSLPPLPAVPHEVELVGALLDSAPLLDSRATRERVLDGMADAAVVHLACHGAGWALAGPGFRMAWDPPAILHLGDEGLSFQDILGQDLQKARLVCLSACDTGLVEHSLPWDEHEGLVTVFLQTGAAAVVSTLWAADDRSTALLMQRFYTELTAAERAGAGTAGRPTTGGGDPARALRRAQLWLRDSTRVELAAVYERLVTDGHDRFIEPYTELMLAGAPDDRPYAHPAFWAPFTFTGA
ncbi:CHAT domain-containing protein [Streptomyces sp. NPDC051636]|uniref:CHAT domain-containing protein n=1 Tax=Streptomyces sp. NPDC051636 TaxID=3365663 RepID=UPI00379D0092